MIKRIMHISDSVTQQDSTAQKPRKMPARKNKADKARENGFTLVELLVVIFIIGLLATIVAINVLPAQDTASITTAKANIRNLEQAIETYRLDHNRYPETADGLQALKTAPASLGDNVRFPAGGYVRGELPKDPWGNAYQYVVPGPNGTPYAVYSLGADGQPGGSDLNADIYAGE